MTDQPAADVQFGRQFVLVRNSAVIADGTEFPNGHVAIHWTGTTYPTLTPHQTMDAANAAHNEDGAVRVVWQLAGIPQAEYSSVWPELVGWVTAAHEDGEQIDPEQLLEYMRELKQRALAPVEQWMDSVRSTAPQADGQHRPPCVDGDHCGEAAHCPPIASANTVRDAARQTAGQPAAAESECAMPGFMDCGCNHLSGCQHPAPAAGPAAPTNHNIEAEARAAAFREAEEIAVRAARSCGDSETGQYAASVAAGIARQLRDLAAGAES